MDRRTLLSALPAMAVLAELAPAADASLPSVFLPYDEMTVHKNANGSVRRDILRGKVATGEALEAHATELPPGGRPHPPHHHVHSEMWLIREGTVELTINGKTQRLGPGAAAFVASNEEHGIKNVGSTPARYFVVAVGPGADGAATNPAPR